MPTFGAAGEAGRGCYAPIYYEGALQDFLRRYPTYASTTSLDDLRAAEYSRLDRLGHVYLDYTGGGLYAESQLRAHLELLAGSVFGNPHSNNPTSLAMTELVDRRAPSVLEFFSASPDEYTVIFTPNASGALKLVGESYPFGPGGRYLLTFDNHNSVNGIREFAQARGAQVTYVPRRRRSCASTRPRSSELARQRPAVPITCLPIRRNPTSPASSIRWSGSAEAQAAGLGCAARLRRLCAHQPPGPGTMVKPDFVPLSFYKIFGYPTGVGALIGAQVRAGASCAVPGLPAARSPGLGAGRGLALPGARRGRL